MPIDDTFRSLCVSRLLATACPLRKKVAFRDSINKRQQQVLTVEKPECFALIERAGSSVLLHDVQPFFVSHEQIKYQAASSRVPVTAALCFGVAACVNQVITPCKTKFCRPLLLYTHPNGTSFVLQYVEAGDDGSLSRKIVVVPNFSSSCGGRNSIFLLYYGV